MPVSARGWLRTLGAVSEQHWNWMYGKLAQAVGILVTNRHDVRERVWVASKYLLMLDPRMVPPSCKDDVAWILHMLMRHKPFGSHKSAVEATYERTRNATAARIAQRVWRVFHEYQTALEARDDERRRLTTARTRTRARAARAGEAER